MFKPTVIRNIDLILGAEESGPNFKCQLRSVKLTPATNTIRTKTACPDGQYSATDTAEWTMELGYLVGEDNGTAPVVEALADFLLTNAGDELPFTFRPVSGVGTTWTGTVVIVPGAFGGTVGEFSEESVQLPLIGQPVKTVEP